MVEQNIILHHTEKFSFEKIKTEGEDGKETIILSGNAQPLKEDSRNGVRYREASVKKAFKSLANVAFLFNHNTERSIGHTTESGLTETHVTYKVDMDPEEKDLIRKVERQDIKHVSVGCMVENIEWNEEENIYICDVKEYAELSLVPVPGFSNTSVNKEGAIYLANALGNTEALEKLKTESKNSEEKTKEADEQKPDSESSEGAAEEGNEESDESKEEPKSEANDDDEDEKDKDKDEEDDDSDDDNEDNGKEGDKDSDDSDDSKEGDDEDDKDKDEADDDDDKEESLKKKEIKEDAGTSDDEERTAEERISDLESKNQELESKLEEFDNRLAIAESKVDAMNDNDENLDNDDENSEELMPDTSENFKDEKPSVRTKAELNAKEKTLFGENTKKVNESKEVVDMNELRLKNMSK